MASAIAQGFYDTLTKNGIKMTRSLAVDSNTGAIDLSVQSQALTRALASSPDAVAYFVLDPSASRPQISQAMDAGIPVFASFGKPEFDVSAYIPLNDDNNGYVSAKYLAERLPAGAEVAILGGPATPNVKALEQGALSAFQEAGVKIVGDVEQQRNLDDNADGGKKVMQGILQRFPKVQGVFAYNDDSAIGAIAAAKQAGADVKFTSRNGTADAVAAVKSGDLLATCDLQPIQFGQSLGQAVVDQLKGSRKYSNSEQIAGPDTSKCLITPENAGSWKPYDQQLNYRTIPMG
ncbi:sugar ABC transporter substrate-binding protein [Paenarthrobacter sp. NPDC089322]|uniref:sugar ABC transporter substrate-binding protein n=1 Tax=Paenarthrobacter sp. NPDC089322 TaxID=3155065 RepID=UPI003445A762